MSAQYTYIEVLNPVLQNVNIFRVRTFKKVKTGDLPDPGIEAESPALQADSVLTKPPGKPNGKTRQN